MSEPPRRRSAQPSRHLTGRYRADAFLPVHRGLPDERPQRPGCFLLAGLLIAVASAALTALVMLFLRPSPVAANNAIWLGIRWGEAAHTEEEVRNLANLLRVNGIDTAYVWTSWLQEDGTWSETTFDHLGGFVGQFRRVYPEARLYAWIGLPVEVPAYRLDDEAVRSEVAAFCQRAIAEFGFDGLHLNAEPIWDGDENYPTLLREIRQTLGVEIPISVAVPPDWNTGAPGIPVGPYTTPGAMWSQEYKQRIALLADEIVVMAYNSGLSSPQDYEIWMAFQVTQFVSAIAPLEAGTRLLFGIPTYDAEPPGHDPAAETVQAAITGIQRGIGQSGADADMVRGIGIYAEWSTDVSEWMTYRRLWLGQDDG